MATSGGSGASILASGSDSLSLSAAQQQSANGGLPLISPSSPQRDKVALPMESSPSHLTKSGEPLPSPVPSDDAMDVTLPPATSASSQRAPGVTYAAVTSGASTSSSSSHQPPSSKCPYQMTYGTDQIYVDVPTTCPQGQLFLDKIGLGVFFRSLPNTKLTAYSAALRQIVPKEAVTHVGRRTSQVIAYLATPAFALRVLTEGISIGDRHLLATPLTQAPTTVSFAPVPPEVSDDLLLSVAQNYGRTVGSVITYSSFPGVPEDRYLLGFRRNVRVIFPSEEAMLRVPSVLNVRCDTHIRRIDITVGTLCSVCKSTGHPSALCPHRAATASKSSVQPTQRSTGPPASSSGASHQRQSSYSESLHKTVGQRVTSSQPSTSNSASILQTCPQQENSSTGDQLNSPLLSTITPQHPSEPDNGVDAPDAFTVPDNPAFSPEQQRVRSKRRRTTRRRNKKTRTSPTFQGGRDRSESRSLPSDASSISISDSDDSTLVPLTLEDFIQQLEDSSLPQTPISGAELYSYLIGPRSKTMSHDFLQSYLTELAATMTQVAVVRSHLQALPSTSFGESGCLKKVCDRLSRLQRAADKLLEPPSDISVQDNDTEL